jgi:hypothetical protein
MASGVMARLPAQSWLAIIAALTPKAQRPPQAPERAAQGKAPQASTGL